MSCSITCSIDDHEHCTVKCDCTCHKEVKKKTEKPAYQSGLDDGGKKPKKGKKVPTTARPGDTWTSQSKVSLEEVSMAEEREAARKPEDSK